MIISYDCLLKETWLNFFGLSDFIFKTFVSTLLPFAILMVGVMFSILCKLLLWKWLNMLWMITISAITIVFTLYSNTSSLILNLFTCWTVEDELVLARDV